MSYMIGVDENRGLVFEGDSYYGAHLVWPVPVMTSARFVDSSAKDYSNAHSGSPVTYYFREDMFDPVSRIRRGRFYKYANASGGNWQVIYSPHVSIPHSGTNGDALFCERSLSDYRPCVISGELNDLGLAQSIVVLGKEKSSTIWSIIHIETSFTGEEMVTLKARQSLGALPAVNFQSLPPPDAKNIQEALQTLEDDYHLASPESVVDRANEAATRILNAYLFLCEGKTQDSLYKATLAIGKLAAEVKKEVARNAADIVRLLHGRTKYAVQKENNARVIREQDAELAVQCIGVMLCDLGWAEWR